MNRKPDIMQESIPASPQNPALQNEQPPAGIDLEKASPEEIKAEIELTRSHMDEHLAQLGRKFSPNLRSPYLWIPILAGASLLGGFLAYRILPRENNHLLSPPVARD